MRSIFLYLKKEPFILWIEVIWILNAFTATAYFVFLAKSNIKFKRRYSRTVEMNAGVQCDHTVVLTGLNSSAAYPNTLRRVHYYDTETEKHFNFLTNNFVCLAQTIADLYRYQ